MQLPALPHNEAARLRAIQRMDLAGPERDERCQRYARLARVLADTPIAAVSIIGPDEQWFRGCEGASITCTPRAVSFCGHAIHEPDVLLVPDACQDPRFAGNPLVTGEPRIRFYAGCPIRLPDNLAIGALCVIDSQPRMLDESRVRALRDLADCLQSEMSTLLSVADMGDVARELFATLPDRAGPV